MLVCEEGLPALTPPPLLSIPLLPHSYGFLIHTQSVVLVTFLAAVANTRWEEA